MNPKTKPMRLNDFLSQLLHQQVTVLQVLPADSTRIADESSLIIMDIVVESSDGSIANVEVQRIGYLFPGQRCACYSADLPKELQVQYHLTEAQPRDYLL